MKTKTPTDTYAESTALTNVLGTHSKTKILGVMLGAHEHDLTATDISRMAGIDRATFYDHIDTLLDYGVIKITREAGNSKMYKINKDSDAAQDLAAFEWDLLGALNDEGNPDARVDEREK